MLVDLIPQILDRARFKDLLPLPLQDMPEIHMTTVHNEPDREKEGP